MANRGRVYVEEPEDYVSDEYEEITETTNLRPQQRRQALNYGKIFAIDENVLNKGFTAMTGSCREKIKPEIGKCIERAANKFDLKTENELGENDCNALWDLMCCSTHLIAKKCNNFDLKVINVGFYLIQKLLETKGCTDAPRSGLQCLEVINDTQIQQNTNSRPELQHYD